VVDVIHNFRNQYSFLSNFYLKDQFVDGVKYASNEHFYQCNKTLDPVLKGVIRNTGSPKEAKSVAKTISLRPDWEAIKVQVMLVGLRSKFHVNTDIAVRLLATGNKTLVEGNYWHDNYWGICFCRGCQSKLGKNVLGQLLMLVRDELQDLPFFNKNISA